VSTQPRPHDVEPGQVELPAGEIDFKYLRGKDGWLFLDRDTNRLLDQHTGALTLTEDQLRAWQRVLENRIAWLGRRGIPYLFQVAPNPHVVYEDKLPDGVRTSPGRPLMQLTEHLERSGSEARLLYPVDELIRHRDRAVYPRTATHWSELGAFIAYEQLMDGMTDLGLERRLEMDDVDWVPVPLPGDLGNKLKPVEQSEFVFGDIRDQRARLVLDNRVVRTGRRVEFEAPGLSRTCLVVADSYAVRVVPFLAESFGRLVFGHVSTLDYELVEEVRPDVVVTIISERFLIEVPEDLHPGAPTLRELEAGKLARGEVLRPRPVETNRLNFPR
jgi:alginate O-acetyltransferase complex protein AlgJ